MLSPEERALLTSVQDQMIELLVSQDEARHRRDDAQVTTIQDEIDRLARQCEAIRSVG